MIVQGALEAILGVLLLLAGLFITSFAAEILAAQQRQGGQAKMPTEEMLMVYAILGAALLVLAGIRIFAGIRNLSFRGRTLGIIAVSAGLLTSITCYCAPTSVGLMIYGLIVYLNGNVAETFRACEAGMPPPTG